MENGVVLTLGSHVSSAYQAMCGIQREAEKNKRKTLFASTRQCMNNLLENHCTYKSREGCNMY